MHAKSWLGNVRHGNGDRCRARSARPIIAYGDLYFVAPRGKRQSLHVVQDGGRIRAGGFEHIQSPDHMGLK